MGRKFEALIAALILMLAASRLICAQPPGRSAGKQIVPAPIQPLPDRLQAMSPEDRQRFTRNAERWLTLDDEQRKIMREREALRRQRLQQEAEAALRESGLHLDAEKRAAFESRYIQERAKVEHNMHQELEAKREMEKSALVDRLKKEFQSEKPKPSASASASGSPK